MLLPADGMPSSAARAEDMPATRPTVSANEEMIFFIGDTRLVMVEHHPFRDRLGLFPTAACVQPQEHEVPEVKDGHHATEEVLGSRCIGGEPLEGQLADHASTHHGQADEGRSKR